MRYLGIRPARPRIGVFDFTSCEGCELQLANKEDTLVDFLQALQIVHFREISSQNEDTYEIAFIEGAITRSDEVQRLQHIRDTARLLIAFGSCACFGGVARLKNHVSAEDANRIVYGNHPKETLPARAVHDVVRVDLEIPGCPVSKMEVERIVRHLVLDVPYAGPVFPVCVECKQLFNVCLFEIGRLCLGPIARAGCGAPCPSAGLGCYGCRGPAVDPNYQEFFAMTESRGFDRRQVLEQLSFFGGFEGVQ